MTDSIDDTVAVDAMIMAPVARAASKSNSPQSAAAEDLAPIDHVQDNAHIPAKMSDALADAVMSQLSSEMPGLTAEQVKSVVAAMNTVQSGDDVGVVRKSADGVLAIRISIEGVHKWHLVNPSDGTRWDDNENTFIMTWPTVP